MSTASPRPDASLAAIASSVRAMKRRRFGRAVRSSVPASRRASARPRASRKADTMRPIAASMVTVARPNGRALSRCTWSRSSSPRAANMNPLGTSSTDHEANLGSGRLGGTCQATKARAERASR